MSETTAVTDPTPAPAPAGVPSEERLRYRLLSGPDDHAFCARVSAALADGYRLYGGPAITFNGERVIVAQAVVLDGTDGSGDTPTATIVPA